MLCLNFVFGLWIVTDNNRKQMTSTVRYCMTYELEALKVFWIVFGLC